VIERTSGGLTYYAFPGFSDQPGLVHAISSRHGGVSDAPYDTLNLSLTVADVPERVRENRQRFAEALGVHPNSVCTARQVHGAGIWEVREPTDAPPEADIMLTSSPGVFLSQRFADCVPILLWDPTHRSVAAAHAGWRGTAQDVAGIAVRAMADRFNSQPGELYAAIGPSIGPCCYEVGSEVARVFAAVPACIAPRANGKAMLDLWELNRRGLLAAGVFAERIELASICTSCHSARFFSHRAHGFPAGRFGSLIGLAP
jgi:YfiH family protein